MTNKNHRAYIALGSNLNDPQQQLNTAINTLSQHSSIEIISVSPFYQSKPLGPQDQPDYVNAVIEIITSLSPLQLLDELQTIELQQGRIRHRRWGERTLDLDILLYDNDIIESERLTIPHYAMQTREFVIIPLYDIAPTLCLPQGIHLHQLVQQFQPHQLIKLADNSSL